MSAEQSGEDRRNFYRLEDQIYLEYRLATAEEVKKYAETDKAQAPHAMDTHFHLDALSRQIAPLIVNIRSESPAIAQYLEGLNRKIDILAGMMFFEKAKRRSGEQFEDTNTFDISEGGVSFDSPEQLPKGGYLFCRVAIAGFQLGLETYGKIVHVASVEGGLFRIGVEFPFISDYERKQLTRYIFEKQREKIRQAAEGRKS